MQVAGLIGSPGWVVKKFQASAALTAAGIPIVATDVATTDIGMVKAISASAASAAIVGISIDTAPDAAATGLTASSDILVSVVINPDALIRARLSGGTTSGTALTILTATAASTNGTVATGVATLDDGAIWGYDGANAGVVRRADDTAGSVSMNFPRGILANDRFLVAPAYPCGVAGASANKFFDLTTDLTEVLGTVSVTDTDNFVVVEIEANDMASQGDANSYFLLVANDHVFGGNPQRS